MKRCFSSSPISFTTLAVAATTFHLPPLRAAIIIDDFTGPSVEMSSSGAWQFADVPALPSTSVIGGHRRVGVDATTSGSAMVHVTEEGASLIPETGYAYLTLAYGTQGPLGLDLLESGMTVMRVEFDYQLDGSTFLPLYVGLGFAGFNPVDEYFYSNEPNGPIILDIPLDEHFDRSRLDDVNQIEVGFLRVFSVSNARITRLSLIPEPSFLALGAASTCLLCFRRSRPIAPQPS